MLSNERSPVIHLFYSWDDDLIFKVLPPNRAGRFFALVSRYRNIFTSLETDPSHWLVFTAGYCIKAWSACS